MKTNKNIKKTAILIPAHNEERVIEATILSALSLVDKSDLYVVDDFSSDNTAKIAKNYTKNVLSLNPNKGKAAALNAAIDFFNLTNNYDFILPMDADTAIDPKFLKESIKLFEGKGNEDVVAVCGKVVGAATNWVTSYRLWEYEIGQLIHKNAQSKERAVAVCPGCATLYKASLFNEVQIPPGTLTEDMDLTFLIHRKSLGRIRYSDKAKVYTQDPKTVRDFMRQLDRWYIGFWQCVTKHNIPWGGQMVDIEIALSATESLLGGVLLLLAFLSVPVMWLINPQLVLLSLAIDLGLLIFPTVLWTAIRYKSWKILFIPGFYFLRILANLIFLKSFYKTVLGIEFRVGWNRVRRYEVKEKKWAISL